MEKSVLFLCTGNSCRSQMAEAWGRHLHPSAFDFYSAGTSSHGLNPYAVKVMQEVGIDISKNRSKTTSELPKIQMDYVVTVCSDANENCPYFPGTKIVHHGFDDPPRLAVNLAEEEEILPLYRRVRDEIKIFVENLEENLQID